MSRVQQVFFLFFNKKVYIFALDKKYKFMGKIFKLYENNVEKTWYDSSNVFYSECDDIEDSYKQLRVVFKNGRQYQYKDINVNDYLLFRENLSQGKALNQFIKPKYEAQRLDDVNIDELKQLLNEYQYGGVEAHVPTDGVTIVYSKDGIRVLKDGEPYDCIPLEQDLGEIIGKLCCSLDVHFINETI